MIRSAQSYITANRYRETLLQEISVYMALKPHPCVTQVKEVVEQDFKIYVFMELLEGGDLHEYVRLADPPMTEDEVRIIFDQLFHATYFLHKSNLVHRDIKLENVLMADKEKLFVKIVDLGLAKFMPDNNDCFATICGTQLYAAPELLRGHGSTQPRFTNKVDIWCLGMMLYICLTGRHPFLDTYEKYTPPETLRCIEENPVDCTEEGFEYVSKEGIDLVKRLLAMDPDERPTIAEVLRHPWLDQIESPRTQVKGLARCPSLVEYLKENPIKETEDGS
ncbi:kinase-like domain-containing protein [Syncephalastrum racemosum]|nr:kinase-like domain-containing protein [Syncephalastrum racemosum]